MKFEKRPCPVCNSTDDSNVFAEANYDETRLNEFSFASRKFPELMHLRLAHCPGCGLLYATPVPVSECLESAYREAEYDSAKESECASYTYIRHVSKILPRLPGLKAALDIGAGDGAFLERLLEAGFENVSGVEPSESPIRAAKGHVRGLIKKGFFLPENYERESFNLITCFQTLEHVNNPGAICGAVYGLLKPGGAFFTVSHNHRSLSAKILGKKSPILDVEHLQLFSPESIRYLLEHTGFTRVRVYPIFNRYAPGYWIKLLPLGAALKKYLIKLAESTGLNHLTIPMPAGNMVAVGFK